jgi:hypothetical protein
MKYTAASLEDIAKAFELYASNERAKKRFQTTKRGKEDCETRAKVWKLAADDLRNTTLTGEQT